MARRKKVDLNIWENQYVTLTLKDAQVTVEEENGDVVTKPYQITGLFVHWDGETIHMNTLDDQINAISKSVLRTDVTLVELWEPPEFSMEERAKGDIVH